MSPKKPEGNAVRLPDQNDRDRILNDLDSNLFVEAAAGTGKTTEMVRRMIALVSEGACRVDQLVAMTFTRKAAAELRSRFQARLEQAAKQPALDAARRARLREAADHLDRAFIGTIHSFCARLLRERPVEARVDVAFGELEEEDDLRLREMAWEERLSRLRAEDPDTARALDALDVDLSGLRDTFLQYALYPDVARWKEAEPVAIEGCLDQMKTLVRGVRDYVCRMRRFDIPRDAKGDKAANAYRDVPRMEARRMLTRPADLARFAEQCLAERYYPAKAVKPACWPSKAAGEQERDAWNAFCRERLEGFPDQLRAWRHPWVMRAIRPAAEIYERLRDEAGLLNYQDLLMRAARLLREGGVHVRESFRDRFRRVLVDEFQDTDPIQAEVLLLLTATDPAETDWRRCRPAPGSLFVVGDPKQSIYRFRRADIATYQEVRRIILATGGRPLALRASFRTTAPLLDWVNATFAGRFADGDNDPANPRYVPLEANPNGPPGDAAPPVCVIRVPETHSTKEAIRAYESRLIARTIRRMLDRRERIPRPPGSTLPPHAMPSDFMVLAWKKEGLGLYAQALEEYGIPHQVTGGDTLNQARELTLLHAVFFSALHPSHPLRFVGALRSELFGISDADLYRFHAAGGVFDFRLPVPETLPPALRAAMTDAFGRFRRCARWLSLLPPVSALEKIADDLGLPALAAAGAQGNARAGAVLKALELLRAAQREWPTAPQLCDYLGRLARQEEEEGGETHDTTPAFAAVEPQVRVMNLHQAKGLEAPVVFLADPNGASTHDVQISVQRLGVAEPTGHLAAFMRKNRSAKNRAGHHEKLAIPPDWEATEALEERYLEAEKTRLLYVAATRAGARLIVSQRAQRGNWSPWQPLDDALADCPDLPDPGEPAKPTVAPARLTASDAQRALDSLSARRARAAEPTYAISRAKRAAVADQPLGGGEHGAEWGSAIHLLLEGVLAHPEGDLRALALSALRDLGLPLDRADEAAAVVRSVMGSDLWRRARAARRHFSEVPFEYQLPVGHPDAAPVPTLRRGVIDLIFEEPDGWVIVDYKTDGRPGQDPAPFVVHYRPQLAAYREAWQDCTGEKVKETGIYFASMGWYEVCG